MSTPQEVLDLFRELSGQSIVLSAAIAKRTGLSPADLEVLGAIQQHGPLTAGQLARRTGLSPAAVTGLIDRLERAGVAARKADPADRRRVLVAVSSGAEPIAAIYRTLERDARRVLKGRNPAELEAIAAFLREMNEVGVAHVARLQRD
jgi:DNA-binding MarR family transcriptional regulator